MVSNGVQENRADGCRNTYLPRNCELALQRGGACGHRCNRCGADRECGDLIRGTGGFRKVRVARKGMGESGGARIIYM